MLGRLAGRIVAVTTMAVASRDRAAARPKLPPGYAFRYLAAADLSAPLFAERGRAERFRARAEAGHLGLAIVDAADTVAAYFWLSGAGHGGAVPVALGLSARFEPDTGYVWDCRTAPAHRRRGLYAAGAAHGADLLLATGAARAWIAAERGNVASRAGISRAGFAASGAFSILALGPWRRLRSPAASLWTKPGAVLPWRAFVGDGATARH
jgi:hypothetical protein